MNTQLDPRVWSLGILFLAWLFGTASVLAMMAHDLPDFPELWFGYIALLAFVQAVSGWAYFGVRASRAVEPPAEPAA